MPEESRERRLMALWYGSTQPPLGLRLLACVYGAALRARRALYRSGLLKTRRVTVPVVIVGNVTVGGTGKSPLAAWLVGRLVARGRRPGIASRGYGRRGSGVHLVSAGDDPGQVGDEPLMLHLQTGVPVCVGAHRGEVAQRLIAAGCDLVVCDDGLQHLALARDFEIVVVDGQRGLGNGRLLPAGPLREAATRLASVDAVVVNGPAAAAAAASTAGPAPGARELRMMLEPDELRAVAGTAREGLAWLRGRTVHAVTGIGNPQRFFALLRDLGADVREHAFGDHHAFTAADIEFPDALPVIMTAKDAVKCAALAGGRHWYLPVSVAFAPGDEQWLLERILALAMEERLRD